MTRFIFQRFLGLLIAAVLFILVPAGASSAWQAPSSSTGWSQVPAILSRIKAPVFPNRDFKITDYGAVADGQIDNTEAIRKTIVACNQAGGGRVVVPPGVFLTGAIHLKSNVNLHISEGATLKFIPDPAKYLPVVLTRFEGTECMNYSPLIYAYEQQNIAITGKGVLDGSASAENWWAWKRTGSGSVRRLLEFNDKGTPVAERVFGEGYKLRTNFIQPYRSRNILIEGVTINNSPMWEIHPVLCTNVTVRGVTVVSHGPNNDGCNPESCRDVLIEDCIFDTGDDCIAIKSGRNNDGRRIGVPSENIIVRNCTMKDGHGGVVMGSEISGGVRNVFIENCKMDSPNLDRALRFKSNALRGGVIENIFMRNVEIGRVAEAILTVDFLYETGANGPHKPVVRNVAIENVRSASSPRVLWIAGFPGATIDNIRFTDCTFRGVEASEQLSHAGSISFRNVAIEPAKKGRSRNSIGQSTQQHYLFAYFKNNGEDGLHLAYSRDGLKWRALNEDKSFLTPKVGSQKLMRDPCIILGLDGVFHMVWTTGWRGQDIGIAHSKDLINWSEQKSIPVMAHEPAALNCWAPEIFYDEASRQYLIFWATTIPARFPATEASGNNGLNHRIYFTTTKDFVTYSKAELFYDGGFNVIDATIVKHAGKFVMILKDETQQPVRKNLRIAVSDKATGPYGAASAPYTPDWVEGPTAIKINDEWIVYYDMYRDHRYGAVKSRDLKNWEIITDRIEFPKGARHGTVLKVSDEIISRLL